MEMKLRSMLIRETDGVRGTEMCNSLGEIKKIKLKVKKNGTKKNLKRKK